MRRFSKGFTLVEIMIVLSIITMLSILSFGSYSQITRKSRNTKRKSDLKELEIALEQFHKVNNSYPQTYIPGNPRVFWGTCSNYGSHDRSGANGYIPNLAPNFVTLLPVDPKSGIANTANSALCTSIRTCYTYASDGINFKLMAMCTPEGTISPDDPFRDPTIKGAYAYSIWSSNRSENW